MDRGRDLTWAEKAVLGRLARVPHYTMAWLRRLPGPIVETYRSGPVPVRCALCDKTSERWVLDDVLTLRGIRHGRAHLWMRRQEVMAFGSLLEMGHSIREALDEVFGPC